MGSIGDIVGKDAKPLGQTLLSSGVVAEVGASAKSQATTLENDDAVVRSDNKNIVLNRLVSGAFMTIEDRHVSNYDDLVRQARAEGFPRVTVVLETANINKGSSRRIIPTGDGEATVVVNEAVLKPTPEFTRDHTEHQLRHGKFIELSPELAGNYGTMAQAATNTGFSKSPRVVLDKANTHQTPSMQVSALPDGVPLVRVNPLAHEWTPQFAREHFLPRDSDVSQQIVSGQLVGAMSRMDSSVVQYMQESARRRGLAGVSVFVDTASREPVVSAFAVETAEGARHIEVNDAFLRLKPEQQRALLDHELAHFQLGHVSAEGRAAEHNQERAGNSGYPSAMEAWTDRVGVCGAPNPDVTARNLADVLKVGRDELIAGYRSLYPAASYREIVKEVDEVSHVHPPMKQRIGDVLDYPGSCSDVAPLATPKGATSGGQHK